MPPLLSNQLITPVKTSLLETTLVHVHLWHLRKSPCILVHIHLRHLGHLSHTSHGHRV